MPSPLAAFAVAAVLTFAEQCMMACEPATSVAPPTLLAPVDDRACVFAGSDFAIRYRRTGAAAQRARNGWQVRWRLAKGARTLDQGATQSKPVAAAGDSTQLLTLRAPALRSGVTLSAELHMVWTNRGFEYRHSRSLHLFAPMPFATRRSVIGASGIWLYDPAGDAASLFAEAQIPYQTLMGLAALDEVRGGVVIVGQDAGIGRYSTFLQNRLSAAAQGVSTLCLAPTKVVFSLPTGQEAPHLLPACLQLQRSTVVRRYDKRFDLMAPLRGFTLGPRPNQIAIGADPPPDGWCWLSMEPTTPTDRAPGRVILCGLPIESQWRASPVPRYLLAHVLDDLSNPTRDTKEPLHDETSP